ncbi:MULTISPECIES: shikimate kinase [Bacillus]|uniref:Shikimate kinase n=2 Tax=Bacillus cereus group TaxID=86661 RepID=R8Q376_BACCE|nr:MULTISPECIES: shikimate kinase [Bacillus cereus group]EOP65222.1 shikimate kinase [Bacillus cereus VD118]MBJ8094344.1 shikimate kinase [Bacillus cereus]MCQ6358634.1 shikimate kinase [Bacillus cereus]CAH2466322.1 Catalyzes the specific phosphorylation of the 3-hydroxyl group of shikimic acid using ATP as a cosubstrate [Bacillus mycoides KBAB4]SCB70177.1 Shikimate kinase [Bacillus mycoides]
MKSIYIIGYMGAGKTTIGKALSKELHMEVVDTDQKIEEQKEKAIWHIFAEEGEMVFREYESEMLRSLPVQNVIITTGGGIIEREENRKWMKENGTVVYLYCDPHVIAERLREDTTRPLFQKKDIAAFVTKFESRRAYYEEADIHIDTTNKSVKQIMNELKQKINE